VSKINRKILYGFVGGAILSVVGLVTGLITGANIGGNYFPDFEFMSGRGWEATGYLGAIIGAGIGMILGILLGIKIADRKVKGKLA